MNRTIYLPISVNYVSHWGFWEAAREILQNAIDTNDFDVEMMRRSGILSVTSGGGKLDLSTLMLGESSKRDDESSIGKYGEGYKLAMLVLCRLGMGVTIRNGSDKWVASIKEHPELKSECLCISVSEYFYGDIDDKVTFTIDGLNHEHFNDIETKFIDPGCDFDVVAEYCGSTCFEYDEYERKVFVGGLYVCDLDDDYHYSYNFAPSILELDRDRASVSEFNLQYEATRLITSSGNLGLLADLANDSAKDISNYYNPRTSNYSYGSASNSDEDNKKLEKFAVEGFISNYGENAYPISRSDNEKKKSLTTDKCISLGLKPVVVEQALFNILPQELKDKITHAKIDKSVSAVLCDYLERNKKHMRSKPAKELMYIIEALVVKGL